MGYSEIIRPDGLRIKFEQNRVMADIVPMSECCDLCNDPRMVNDDGLLKCVGCGVINRIDYGHYT